MPKLTTAYQSNSGKVFKTLKEAIDDDLKDFLRMEYPSAEWTFIRDVVDAIKRNPEFIQDICEQYVNSESEANG